jgi:hypothetical protein
VIPRPPTSTASDGESAPDPMADIASIVDDALAAGFDQRRLAFVSVYMRFAERQSWEHAAAAAAASWEVAVYSTEQGHMLRLARKAHPTVRDLAELRLDALEFADANSGDWLSMSIENLQQLPTAWQALTAHDEIVLPAPRGSEVESDDQVQMIHRGSTA